MEKKNTTLIVILVIFALIIGLLGGYIIGKQIENKNDKNSSTTNNTDNKDSDVSKEYSLTEAEKLMDKYSYDTCGKTYITDLNGSRSLSLAIDNTKSSEKVSCDSLGLDKYVYGGITGSLYDQCTLTEDLNNYNNLYKYDDVLATYKSLYGSSKKLEKKSFDAGTTHYYYYSAKDAFVNLNIPTGYACPPVDSEASVLSAKTISNTLEIVAANLHYAIETEKSEEYKYTFKKENGNYYLADITKIN